MADFYFTGQTTIDGDEVIASDARLSFFGATFGDAITKDEYQTTTHVESAAKAEQCTVNHIHNCKYLTISTVDVDGAGSTSLSVITDADCTLELRFNHTSAVACSNVLFWAFDNTTDTNDPTGIMIQAAEGGDANWTDIRASSGSDLALGDSSSATNHYWYIPISVSPTSVGEKTACGIKASLTYQ